ncbi:MAG TPA: AAA family ATPase [Stellaceae bacterium]|nr:AAA family ATPase [Stellaceae bacterium]
MRLRNFTAPSMPEAMALVREALGADAIIVSAEDEAGAVRVTAAAEERDLGDADTGGGDDVTDRLSEALSASGVPGSLAEKLLMASLSFETGDELAALSGALSAVFAFEPVPEREQSRPLLLVGPPGVGKTMTVAKLAARAVLGKRRVRMITADTVRAGAIEQLGAVARILGLQLKAVQTPDQLAKVVATTDAEELVLIDSPGINPYNTTDRRELAQFVIAAGAEPMLVLAAGGDALDAVDMARIFRDLGSARMTATRLDLTHRLGSVLAAAEGARLAFAEAGVSADIADGLIPFAPLALARLLLAKTALPHQQPAKRRGTP